MKVYLGYPEDGVSRLYPNHGLEAKNDLSANSGVAPAEKEGSDKTKEVPENDGNDQLAYSKRKL